MVGVSLSWPASRKRWYFGDGVCVGREGTKVDRRTVCAGERCGELVMMARFDATVSVERALRC